MDLAKKRRLNIVVVGRSGVGKSSFLNYAAGEKVFETGIGEPVTQEYFQEIDIQKPGKNITFCLFDTKGLEAGNTKEWKDAVFSEIDKRDTSSNIYDWFHTIIFCIDASSKRIQPFEIKAINEMANKGSVLVLLTKRDLVDSPILDALKSQIISDVGRHVQILSVCSVSSRTRKGETHASGLEDVLRVSFWGLWEKVAKVLPNQAITPLVEINTTIRNKRSSPVSDALAYYSLKIDRPTVKQNLTTYPNIATLHKIHCDDSTNDIYSIISDKTGIPYKFDEGDIILTIKGDARDYLNIPNRLYHESLDVNEYRNSIKTFLLFITDIVDNLRSNLVDNNETNKVIRGNKLKIHEVLTFYKDITGYDLRHIDDQKTKEAGEKLEDASFYENFWDEFVNKKDCLIRRLNTIDSCFIFSGEERRDTEEAYHSLKEYLEDFISELTERIDNLRKFYTAELHAYGEYCIREDELSENFDNKDDLLTKIIKEALSDGIITPKEYSMIRLVALQQGITDCSEIDKIIQNLTNY